ncbi:BPSL1445 family SYLF domain-containing lipoprotein [Methylophaga sp.]|uniref:BPSL1445 family SYLF domain-containing lipoprotein n=1 Tax=Methylophaga sp. TaxID=2024840 RepID=UPI003F695EF6
MKQLPKHLAGKWAILVSCLGLLFFVSPAVTMAASATEIDIGVNETLKKFQKEVSGGSEFLQRAHGVLVFPKVIKAGFGIGGEYGEGALQINGETVDYYSTAAASIGLQLGAQSKSLVVVFLASDSLKYFRNSKGWKAGVDGSVAVVEWGAGEDINTIDIEDPIVGFVFSNKGLMFNLTLEGSKFTRLNK